MVKKMRRGQKIRFTAISDFTGDRYEAEGIIKGKAKEIKAIDPDNFGGMEDDEEVYLVVSLDNYGNTNRHVIFPEDIVKEQ
jgi:hypothetical protein